MGHRCAQRIVLARYQAFLVLSPEHWHILTSKESTSPWVGCTLLGLFSSPWSEQQKAIWNAVLSLVDHTFGFWIYSPRNPAAVFCQTQVMVSPSLENRWNSFYERCVRNRRMFLSLRVEPNAIHVELDVERKPFVRPNEVSGKMP